MPALLQAGSRPTLAILTLAVLFSWTGALGQQLRLMPVRSAPLGSPVGTVGGPVTAEFNTALGCWEYRISAGGIEVDLELQANGWGNAAGSPTLGAVQGTILPSSYANGQGGDLNPKGWPGSPGDGAYQPRNRCEGAGDLSPCSPPFDPTCDNGNNGECVLASNWVMPECADDLRAIATSTLAYAWAAAAQVDCNIDDGSSKTLGGLILEVPSNASGTYVISLDPDPIDSFMTSGAGMAIPGVALTPACITVITGSCCFNIGPNQGCLDNLTEQECQTLPPPRIWREGEICSECGCCGCQVDSDCDDGDACTDDICDVVCCNCRHTVSYDEVTECCDSASGDLTTIDDENACTIDICHPSGHVSHSANYNEATECCDPDTGNIVSYDQAAECCDSSTGEIETIDDENACTIDICHPDGDVTHTADPDCFVDADAFTKNRYVSFETGVLTVDVAFQVRMTASAHFPESVGDLGWVGAPDGNGTALVVPDPVFLPSWPAIVRAGDCEIVPAATYEIRATVDGVNFDAPVVVETTAPPIDKFWGDIVGDFNGAAWTPPNGVQNFADVQAAIKTFQGGQGTAPLTWADIEPETPNRVVNFNDVQKLVLAFSAAPYPFSDPANCP